MTVWILERINYGAPLLDKKIILASVLINPDPGHKQAHWQYTREHSYAILWPCMCFVYGRQIISEALGLLPPFGLVGCYNTLSALTPLVLATQNWPRRPAPAPSPILSHQGNANLLPPSSKLGVLDLDGILQAASAAHVPSSSRGFLFLILHHKVHACMCGLV